MPAESAFASSPPENPMRPLRRPPIPDAREDGPVIVGAVALRPTDGGSRPGAAGAPGGGPPSDRVDLHVTDLGLIVAPAPGASLAVPSLVPWSSVVSVDAVGMAQMSDGSSGRVLEVESGDGQWLGDNHRAHFALAYDDVALFLSAVSARTEGPPTGPSETRGPPRSTWAPLGAATALVGGAWAATAGRVAHRGSGESRDGARRRFGPILVGLMALVLLAGSARTFDHSASGAAGDPQAGQGQDSGNGAQAARVHTTTNLPAATSVPEPAPPSLASSAPLQSHEIFGYAPYWTLPQSSGFDVKDLTTLAYFSVDANADGTLDESGSGWNGYESQDLVNLVNRSHAAGDRVVLTVTCFSQSSLNAITSDPNAAARLSSALIAAVSAKNLDGVNFDFEGEGSADRNGLTALLTSVSNSLHAANPHWQVTMATYASAAADSSGFYDVAALAPALDGFFVMAYDMNSQSTPSPTAPLSGGSFNDTEALQQFTAVVPASKVILGVPYYGYDWPTTDGTSTAQATGGESPLSYSVIAASGHPTYWDPTTQTPWTAYQVGTQWHETYFDNPTSLALKAQLANSFHIAGLGIWALGMDGNDAADMAALLGNAPPAKDYQTGPTVTIPPGTGFTTTGVWNGVTVGLSPVTPPPSDGTAQFVGTISGITTNAPALACLQTGPAINVWTFSTWPGLDVAVAVQPADCAQAMFTFIPPAPAATTTTTTPTTTTTTTTTMPPTTTTTTDSTPTSSTTSTTG